MKKKSLVLITGFAFVMFGSLYGYAEDPDAVISGVLVENATDYVTVGNYSGMDVEKSVYTVTDNALSLAIDNLLYENTIPQEVDRPAQEGDTVVIDVSATVEGDEELAFSEQDYSFDIGYQDFGEEFDNQLIGTQAGDQKTFSCSYAEDFEYSEWAGKTLNFDVTVKVVQETIVPEYDDTFIKDIMGFDSKEAFEASVEEDLIATYEEQSNSEVRETVINDVMEISTFNGYPQDLYDDCNDLIYESYESFATAFGMTMDELFEIYELSTEDLDADVLDTVNRRLLISAVCQADQIQLTEGDFNEYVEKMASLWSYDSADALLADYGRNEMLWYLYEDRVSDLLLERVNLTDVIVPMDSGMDALDAFEEDPDAEELEGFSDDEEWEYDGDDEDYEYDDDYYYGDEDDYEYEEYYDEDYADDDGDYEYEYDEDYDDSDDIGDYEYDDDDFEIEISTEFEG